MPRLYVVYDTAHRIEPMPKVPGIYQAMVELPEGLEWVIITCAAEELINLLMKQFVEKNGDGEETSG